MPDSVRINQEHKRAIERRIVGTRFDVKKAEIKTRRESLAKACYEHAFTQKERDLMASLPAGWMHSTDSFYVRIGGTKEAMKMGGGVSVRVPLDSRHGESIVSFSCSDKLGKEFVSICDAERSLDKEKDELGREIRAVLHSATTSTKLVKVWPEIRQIVEQVCQTTTSENLPAPRVKYLNKILGLPPKDASKAA